jgi:hypothetical protein
VLGRRPYSTNGARSTCPDSHTARGPRAYRDGEVSDFIDSNLRGETYQNLKDVDTAAEAMIANVDTGRHATLDAFCSWQATQMPPPGS